VSRYSQTETQKIYEVVAIDKDYEKEDLKISLRYVREV
jgi:hypothetical protein